MGVRDGPDRSSSDDVLERGWSDLDRGHFDDALRSADAVLAAVPGNQGALSLRAAALEELGRLSEACAAHEALLRLSPDDMDVLADAAEFFLAHGTEEPATEEWTRRGLELARTGADAASSAADEEAFIGFVVLETQTLTSLGRGSEALARIDSAIHAVPTHPALAIERGVVLFDLCRFDEAREQLEAVVRAHPRDPTANHTLGLIAERMQRRDEAEARFRVACEEAPDEFPAGIRLSPEEFDTVVEDALREFPPEIAAHLSNVVTVVEDVPSVDDLLSADPPLSPTILGMFRGAAIRDRASADPWAQFPASIVLYQRNLERFATDRDDLVEQIRITVLHEVGHLVGLDDEQLRARDLD